MNHIIKTILWAIVVSLSPITIDAQSMLNQKIDSNWEFRQLSLGKWMPATVPGTVHTDLMANGVIEDPFYRINETTQQWIDKVDWEYRCTFNAPEEITGKNIINLLFKGLDTYATVYLNSEKILESDNMHRTWKVDVKNEIKKGENTLHIVFDSPIKRGMKELEKYGLLLPASNDQSENGGMGANKVSVFTRKAGYHYGWDWGPRLVTSGIWRDVILEAADNIIIEDLFIKQNSVNAQNASITAQVAVNNIEAGGYVVTLLDKKRGSVLNRKNVDLAKGNNTISVDASIRKPQLWWPAGMGNQNMYLFEVQISKGNKTVASHSISTGLRTIELVREKDQWGESFYFKINNVPLFAKGANYIPNDSFLPRVGKKGYDKVVADAVNANMNMLRVWGGGVYEDDYFYQLCDEKGILVWQDFMFACSMYPGNDEFLENIRQEAIDNVVRLRNHPSIALWCGNNEINLAWHYYGNGGWGWKQKYTEDQQKMINEAYLAIFHNIIPAVVDKYSHGIDYWPSSPQAGYEAHQHAGDKNTSGDMHYWGVWHSLHPFSDYDKYKARFMSEYGFQSFPEFETVKKYALPEDYDIESTVMSSHQRSGIGNLRIREYMGQEYNVPAGFEQFLYMSQVLQAKGIKAAIEAHRRARPYCMGTLYWQINDCWPVASWSSTDYYHNWKAMHYMAKKAFEPVTLSMTEEDGQLKIYAISDRLKDFKAQLSVTLMGFDGKIIGNTKRQVTVAAATSQIIESAEIEKLLNNANKDEVFLNVTLSSGKDMIANSLYYFDSIKNLKLLQPEIKYSATSSKPGFVTVSISSTTLVKDLMLSIPGRFAHFSDNYFDLMPGSTVKLELETELTAPEVEKELAIRHLMTK